MSVRALSARLGELGRPILASGINKVEQGQRRVDTDELIAFAVALGVNPNALLLPAIADGTMLELLPGVAVTADKAWKWADGREPLKEPFDEDDHADFQMRARPKGRRQYYRRDELSAEDRKEVERRQREIAQRLYPGDQERQEAHMDREGRKLYGEQWPGTWA